MRYSINFQALALWLGIAAVIGGGYFIVSSDSSQQTSFNIGMEEDTVPGELTRLSVEKDGDPVDGANISIDGEFIGTTNSQGIKGFETPENNFTVEASKGDISKGTTFAVEDGSFSSPDDSEGSDNGEDSDDSSDGSNNQDDSEDTVDSDNGDQPDDGQDDQDQQQDDTTEEISSDFTGLELDEEPLVGELRTLTVYEDGEEVSGAEVTVNGEVVGTTNTGGIISFGVPDSAQISISTDSGLSETFSVVDYTEEKQNQTGDQNDTEDLTTGIELDSDPVSGTTNRIILYDEGDRVSGETVYLDGNDLGQTGSNGAIEFEVPLKEKITITTDYGLESQIFNVTENHPEPDITLLNPTDTASFDTPTGTSRDVTFEASVDITESSGTASLMIDGSEAYTQNLSSGTNSLSTTEALSGGTHNWQIDVDTPEYDVSSSSRSLTVNEVEVQNGLSLQNNATAGEFNYVRLYDSGEPVKGTRVTVNGDSIGNTDSKGEVGFEVPNSQEILIEAQGFPEKAYQVSETLTSSDVQLLSPSNGESFSRSSAPTSIEFDFEKPEDASYQLIVDNQIKAEGDQPTETVQKQVDVEEGTHQAYIRVLRDGIDVESKTIGFEVTEPVQVKFDENRDGESYPIVRNHIGEISFSVDGSANQYQIEIDGTQVEKGEAGPTNYYEHRFQEEGEYTITVKALNNGELKGRIQDTVQAQDPPQPQITWVNKTVENSSPELFFEVNTDAEYDLETIVTNSRGEQVMQYESNNVNPSTITHSKETIQIPKGIYDYSVLVKDRKDKVTAKKEGTFENTAEIPFADIRSLEYNYFGELDYIGNQTENEDQSAHLISFDASVYEEYRYEILIDGEIKASETRNSEEIALSEAVGSLTSGRQYTASLELESMETSKNTTKKIQFTAQ